ncbi:MAG: polysaccharide deacetylase family protein [Candidatus Omnitrophota bacterium]
MKIAILSPGNGNYLNRISRSRDARIHPNRKFVYESLNKFGHQCDYIGIDDLAIDKLAAYNALFLLNHCQNNKRQNEVLLSFLSKNKNIVMTYATQAARDWGIAANSTRLPAQLNFQGKKISYGIKDIDNLIMKINRKWFKNCLPVKSFFNLPVMKVSDRADFQVLASWDQDSLPALVKVEKNGGKLIYFSGILAGTNEAFLSYVLSWLEGNNQVLSPWIPNKKKCVITLFYDYEGIYGNSRYGEYAEKGLEYILSAHKKYNIKGTFNVVGKLYETKPKSIENIIQAGHEIACHTYEHIPPSRSGHKALKNSIRMSLAAHQVRFGENLWGFRSPESKWNAGLLSILDDYKFHWNAEDEAACLPYFLVLNKKLSLIRVPIACDDYPYISEQRSADYMLDRFKQTIEQAIRTNSYAAIGFHPWIEGMREENLNAFEQLLSYIRLNNDLEVMTFGEIFEWWSKRNAGK